MRRILPHGIAVNIRALRERAPEHEALRKYGEIARILTGNPQAEPEDAGAWAASLCEQLGILGLGAHGLDRSQIGALAEEATRARSMKANPIPLTKVELTEIAERAS